MPEERNSSIQQAIGDGRSSPRHTVSLAAEVVEPRSRARLTCRATDLSMGGCYMDMINPFETGTDVHLRLVSGGKAFQAEARVLYATPGMGMGLAFTRMTPAHLEVLSGWMREMGRETAPAPPPQHADETGFDFEAQTKPAAAGNLRAIVAEMVTLLARKRILTDAEAAEFHKKLFRGPS